MSDLRYYHNALAQYGRRNNVILSEISDYALGFWLFKSLISVLADTDIYMGRQDVEACYGFGKADKQKSKQAIVQFVNRKNSKKVASNKKNAWLQN